MEKDGDLFLWGFPCVEPCRGRSPALGVTRGLGERPRTLALFEPCSLSPQPVLSMESLVHSLSPSPSEETGSHLIHECTPGKSEGLT